MAGHSASLVRQIRRDGAGIILRDTGATEARALQIEFLQLSMAQA
jgi:hypothetical protein